MSIFYWFGNTNSNAELVMFKHGILSRVRGSISMSQISLELMEKEAGAFKLFRNNFEFLLELI